MSHVPNVSYEPKSSIAYDLKSMVSKNFQEVQNKTSGSRHESQDHPGPPTESEKSSSPGRLQDDKSFEQGPIQYSSPSMGIAFENEFHNNPSDTANEVDSTDSNAENQYEAAADCNEINSDYDMHDDNMKPGPEYDEVD